MITQGPQATQHSQDDQISMASEPQPSQRQMSPVIAIAMPP